MKLPLIGTYPKRILLFTKEQLEEDINAGLTIKQIAEKYNRGNTNIKKYMKKYGLNLRPELSHVSSQYTRDLYIQDIKLTQRQKSIIIGMILGDGHLDMTKGGRNAAICFIQMAERIDYVEWLRIELQPFVSKELDVVEGITPSGNPHKSVSLSSVRYPEFTYFYNLFIVNGRKSIPTDIENYLDELALTVWYEGDGSTSETWSTLHTQSFTVKENEILLQALWKKFNIQGRIEANMGKPTLVFGSDNHFKLHKIIDPMFHSCFEYKRIPDGRVYVGHTKGERNPSSKLTVDQVIEIKKLASQGVSTSKIAKTFGVVYTTIRKIIKGESWKDLETARLPEFVQKPTILKETDKAEIKEKASKGISVKDLSIEYKVRGFLIKEIIKTPKREKLSTGKKLTAEQVGEIKKLHKEGASVKELAEKYGVVYDSVNNIISGKTWNKVIGKTIEGNVYKNSSNKLTPEQVIEIRKLYTEGMTRKELAEKFGVAVSTIENIYKNVTWKNLL